MTDGLKLVLSVPFGYLNTRTEALSLGIYGDRLRRFSNQVVLRGQSGQIPYGSARPNQILACRVPTILRLHGMGIGFDRGAMSVQAVRPLANRCDSGNQSLASAGLPPAVG